MAKNRFCIFINLFLFFIISFNLQVVVAQKPVLNLVNLKSSTRTDLNIEISDGKEKTFLPITIIKGKHEGAVFTIVAGIHGYEYLPIITVQKIIKDINPEKLKGTLIILPIANVAGFYNRSIFINPADGKNLNRVFPGRENGSISEQIAHYITNQVISKSNIFLDIHAGDGNEDLSPFICYYDNKQNADETEFSRKLCLASGFAQIVVYPYTLTKDDQAEYAFKQASQKGIIALSIESGKLGEVDRTAVDETEIAIYNMLASNKMYEIKRTHQTNKPVFYTKQSYIKSPSKGIFYSKLKSGQVIKQGDYLGYISNEFGEVITEIKASVSGIILYKIGTPPVNVNETMFCIASE